MNSPDVFMAGYARSTKAGALLYNLGHSYLLLAFTVLAGWYSGHPLVLAIGLIWLASETCPKGADQRK